MKRSCKNIDITDTETVYPWVLDCVLRHRQSADMIKIKVIWFMRKTQYGCRPDPVCYMPLPGTCEADVWLTKNAVEIVDGENAGMWEADEIYFRTTMSREEIEANFDTLFERDGLMTEPELPPEERLAELEAQFRPA